MKIDKNEIAQKIQEKGAIKPCHRCGKNQFTVLDGFSIIPLQEDSNARGLVVGGPNVPVALIVCNNCGAITQHALGALGPLPQQDGGK